MPCTYPKSCPLPVLKKNGPQASNTNHKVQWANVLQKGKGQVIHFSGAVQPVEQPAILLNLPLGIYG
jgi:hypothetical protein